MILNDVCGCVCMYLLQVKDEAVALVDVVAPPDHILGSPIGNSDGKVMHICVYVYVCIYIYEPAKYMTSSSSGLFYYCEVHLLLS